MRTFVLVAGIAFALVFIAHIARIMSEGMHLLGEPIFLLTSIGSLAAAIWAAILYRRAGSRQP